MCTRRGIEFCVISGEERLNNSTMGKSDKGKADLVTVLKCCTLKTHKIKKEMKQ